MTLPTTNISVTLVKTELSESVNDVGGLCVSANINKWALKKPYSLTGPGASYHDGSIVKTHALYRHITNFSVYYNKPTEQFRLGDFREYNHVTVAPTSITITSVYEHETDTFLTSPYTLFFNFRYTIVFSALAGEINPANIYSQTARTKLTGTSEGPGGVVIAQPNISSNLEVEESRVFTVPGTGISRDILIENTGANPDPFDFYYCVRDYDPVDGGTYWATPYYIEDTSYRDIFSWTSVSIALTSLRLRYFESWPTYTGGQVVFDLNLANNSGRAINNCRYMYQYRTNAKAWHYLYTFDNDISSSFDGPVIQVLENFTDLDNGDNTINCFFYVQVWDSVLSDWKTIQQNNVTTVLNILIE